MKIAGWMGSPRPEKLTLEGNYAKLVPLDPTIHSNDLYSSAVEPGSGSRFRYLFDEPPVDIQSMTQWAEKVSSLADPLFFAVIDKRSGRAEGRQALMRIEPAHGVIEIGNILWGPTIARSRISTEALFLMARYVFDELKYRRLEWKCDSLNEPSRRAAQRFGFQFEGVFRQHMVVKGDNRDTAWFAMTDRDWPRLRVGYERWLRPENFDQAKQQLSKLVF